MEKIIIFDYDGTLIKKDTVPFLMKKYSEYGYGKLKVLNMYRKLGYKYFQYKFSENIDKEKFKLYATNAFFTLFKGMEEKEICDFFERTAKDAVKNLDPKMIELLNRGKKEGYKIVLISGAFNRYLGPLAKKIGIDYVRGSDIPFRKSENGKSYLDYDTEFVLVNGKMKAEKALDLPFEVDWKNSFSYADSYHDEDILKLVGNPVAVNPDQRLRVIAEELGWEILRT